MRLRVIRYIYFIFIFLIIARLWYWQIIRSDDLVARAENQRLTSQDIQAPRGTILFADGSILTSTQPTYLLYANPIEVKKAGAGEVSNISQTLTDLFWKLDHSQEEQDLLANLRGKIDASSEATLLNYEDNKKVELSTSEKYISELLNKDLLWVNLRNRVDFPTKQKLQKLNLPGLGFEQHTNRFYPEGSSSAHLLGFVASDQFGVDTGYFGLEGYYNGELKGKNGSLTQENDAQGIPILIGTFESKEPVPGKTLTLNVDRTVQHIIEEKLKAGIIKFGAKTASAIVMDPKTGGILAMASYPNYDPGDPTQYAKDYFRNVTTVDGYEPGSTFKVLVMAAGINEGLVKPDTICDSCSGPVQISNYTIRTWNNQYMNNPTMTDIIIHSDNTGMVYVSKKLGIEKMYNYIQRFGFGKPTGVDVQDEESPGLRSKEDWKEIDLATASFGQGISATALQVVRAVSSIANGGYLMEPHVVSSIQDGAKVTKIEPRLIARPISTETASIITNMMMRAVNEGEAKFFRPKGYSNIAGKTGTAQIPVAGHYDTTKTIASFVGFAPANDPKFVMLVRYDQPTSSIYGAETAAPTFFEIAKDLFTYYNIPPNE